MVMTIFRTSYLPQPVFSHGQLCDALSRVGSKEQATICVMKDGHSDDGTFPQNIMY